MIASDSLKALPSCTNTGTLRYGFSAPNSALRVSPFEGIDANNATRKIGLA